MQKKKKQQQQQKQKHSDAGAGAEIEPLIHSHAEFLDRLVELIPARFYLQNDDADSKPWYQGLSRAAKESLKQQSKRNLKLARRQRFDPEFKTTDETVNSVPLKPVDEAEGENKEKSVTYEELRQRLRRKIELLRGNRGEKREFDGGRKRKWGGEEDAAENVNGGPSSRVDERNDDDDEEEEEVIEYGKVKLGDDEVGKKKKKRKLSKAQELERAQRLQEVKKEKPGVAEKESWKAATSRAMGVKVHDNARLIKESMKKGKKMKEKNAEKWKERVETQEKMKEERQKKRRDNIVWRINEKKTRKIAKREKKLMRPGFEGRKDGFITPE